MVVLVPAVLKLGNPVPQTYCESFAVLNLDNRKPLATDIF
jgi:hypothetical protein